MVELSLICGAVVPPHEFKKTWTLPKDDIGKARMWAEINLWFTKSDPRCEAHPDQPTWSDCE